MGASLAPGHGEAMSTPDSTSSGGLLARAFTAGAVAQIDWVDVELDGLRISVAADAARAPIDGELLRLPISYEEQVAVCRANAWVSPWLALCRRMVDVAARRPRSQGLVRDGHPEDQVAMKTLAFTRTFSRRLDGLFASLPAGLSAGPWKWWILDARLVERGAVNHGFYGEVTPGVPVQVTGTAHDPTHWDYSQILQPVRRQAVELASGRAVDLLGYLAPRVPAPFLDAYRVAPPAPDAPERLPALARGDRGPAVARLQRALDDAGASPAVVVDGDFGAETDAAVRAFQARRGLAVDGVVGAGTWSALLGRAVVTG